MSNLSRREFLRYSVSAGAAIGLGGAFAGRMHARTSTLPDKPNVLLIMTDQQRKDTMGAY